jgi:hypothetical protein
VLQVQVLLIAQYIYEPYVQDAFKTHAPPILEGFGM